MLRKGPFFLFSLSVSAQSCPFSFRFVFHCEFAACLFFFHALKTIGFGFCFRSFFSPFFVHLFSYYLDSRQQLCATVNVYVNRFCSYCFNCCCLNGMDAAVHWFLVLRVHISLHRQLHSSVSCFAKWTTTEHNAVYIDH